MLRLRLLTAAAATALLAAPSAFAQDAPPPPPAPVPATPPPVAPATPDRTPPPSAAEAVAPAVAAPAQTGVADTPAQAGSVIDVLTAQGDFTTLLAALERAQLTETLRSRPAISIFAPTDEAFAALPEAERTRLMDPANVNELRTLLLYHVIVADVSSAQIRGARGGVETASRTQVLLDGTGDALRVDGATITRADIDASNGAVFVLDRVLNPAQSRAAMGDEDAAAPAAPAEAPADEAAAGQVPAPTPPVLPVEPPVAVPTPGTSPSAATAIPRPATGQTAPNGRPAATVTTVQAPPVANPTDGQVDDEEDPANPAPTPR